MARIYLTTGETYGTVGAGSNEVNGTTANEVVNVAGNGDAIFDASFNRGGDVINIDGNAADYKGQIVGSNLVLTSANGADIRIPIGASGAAINFNDTSTARVITVSGGVTKLGGQTIGTTVVTLTGGDVTPPLGDNIVLTPGQDIKVGTGGSDSFLADFVQNSEGRQVNSLGTGDNVDGNGGTDELYAQITRAATFDGNGGIGGINGGSNTPIQPRLNDVEDIKLEAIQADLATRAPYGYSYANIEYLTFNEFSQFSNNTEVYFNAKNVRGHDIIWSYNSDANLTVQDLTTVVADGGHDDARNTSDITIGMGYTSGQDTFWDSSDYKVFFDQDYLLTGIASESRAFYFLLDEDADSDGRPPLDFIDVDGIRFTVNGGPVITLSDPDAQEGNTHAGFVAALQDALQDLIDAGLVPADTILYVDPTVTDTTFRDDGLESSPIPAIVLETQTNAVITPVGFSRVEDAIGEYDVYGRFSNESATEDLPLSVNIALEKVGRGGEGGDLIVGSMDKYNNGIEVFDVTVYGDDSRPSWLDYLNSTGDSESGVGSRGALKVINIVSDNDGINDEGFPDDDTYASLTIASTNYDLTRIDAQNFLGDLTLGLPGYNSENGIVNLKTLLATGGGDVVFNAEINNEETGAYSYQTGAGEDEVDLVINGRALEYATSSLNIDTGAGNDTVYVDYFSNESEFPNQVILRNVDIVTGTGDDIVSTLGEGQFRITTGAGNDVIYSEQETYYDGDYSMSANSSDSAHWVFNVDRGAYAAQGGSTYDGNGGAPELDSLPGVPLRYSLLAGATVTVTFSGAGSQASGNGGGVGQYNGTDNGLPGLTPAEPVIGDAIAYRNGYEATAAISLAGTGRSFYGTQIEVNKAILAAINNDPVLNKLLVAEIGANNTLVVSSKIDGVFNVEDLDISINRSPAYAAGSTAVIPAALVQEALALGYAAPGTVASSQSNDTPAELPAGVLTNLYGAPLDNAFYSGVNNSPDASSTGQFNNLWSYGESGFSEADHVHRPGDGNDVVVLSTNNGSDDDNEYWTLDGWLFDQASNETIRFEGGDFGKDTIVNFTTAGVEDYVAPNVEPGPGEPPVVPTGEDPVFGGFDFLDFTSYLTSQFTTTVDGQSVTRRIAVTLEDRSLSNADGSTLVAELNPNALGADTPELGDSPDALSKYIDANEVYIVSWDDAPTQSWTGLTETVVAGLINSTVNTTVYGSLDGTELLVNRSYTNAAGQTDLVTGDARAILMIQNADNLGEYKVFEVRWNGLASANTPNAIPATVDLLGTLDFGTSLDGLDELNLVGSLEHSLFNFDVDSPI